MEKLLKYIPTDMYYVGGYVRDKLLNRESKDIDIEVHNISSEELENCLIQYAKDENIYFHLVGKSFGVYKVGDIDISLPRKERKVGNKHQDFEITFIQGVKEAMKRRDFTINAIYQNVRTNEIVDYYGGLEDLKNKTIRHVDNTSFCEDALRVIRCARFSAKLGFDIHKDTIKLCQSISTRDLPIERILKEMKNVITTCDDFLIFFKQLEILSKETMERLQLNLTEYQFKKGKIDYDLAIAILYKDSILPHFFSKKQKRLWKVFYEKKDLFVASFYHQELLKLPLMYETGNWEEKRKQAPTSKDFKLKGVALGEILLKGRQLASQGFKKEKIIKTLSERF